MAGPTSYLSLGPWHPAQYRLDEKKKRLIMTGSPCWAPCTCQESEHLRTSSLVQSAHQAYEVRHQDSSWCARGTEAQTSRWLVGAHLAGGRRESPTRPFWFHSQVFNHRAETACFGVLCLLTPTLRSSRPHPLHLGPSPSFRWDASSHPPRRGDRSPQEPWL